MHLLISVKPCYSHVGISPTHGFHPLLRGDDNHGYICYKILLTPDKGISC